MLGSKHVPEWTPKNLFASLIVFPYINSHEIQQSNDINLNFAFSEPTTVASGQIKVTVTLPNMNNKRFDGISRDVQLAKWGAAKTAVNELKNRTNIFIPVKQKELLEYYTKMQPPNTLKKTQ